MITFPPINRITIWKLIVILIAVSFTWSQRLSSIGIILLIIHWLIDPNLIKKIKSIQFDTITILLLAFWGLHLIGLTYSNDLLEGWQSVEVKLSCVILPFLFSTEHYLTDKRRNQLLLILSGSCLVAFAYSSGMSYMNYHSKGWALVLNRMSLSESIMHPGYFSNYFALAFVWCVYELIEQRRLSISMKIVLICFIFLLLISIILLASKTAILFLGAFLIFLIWRMTYRITHLTLRIISFLIAIVGFVLMTINVPNIRMRIEESKRDAKIIDKTVPLGNSTGSRIVAWHNEFILIKKHWFFGYGTGEANSQLQNQLLKEGYVQLASDHMHTHMQIMHTWLDIGILGVIFLLAIIVYSGYVFLSRKRWLAAWFTLLIFCNILTDDMFEVQAGIVFFMVFLLLFMYQKEEQKYYGPSYW